MNKPLSDMSLAELWELFPIILKDHNPAYPEWYRIEKDRICNCLDQADIYRMQHFGSTTVEGLVAKPTVDILLEVTRSCDIPRLITLLENNDWHQMSSNYEPELKLSFNKGYTPKGFAEKVYHLHVRHPGDWSELYFRDYLQDHPDTADEYGKLKLRLWKQYEHDRDGYTDAKGEYVESVTNKARTAYGGRYVP